MKCPLLLAAALSGFASLPAQTPPAPEPNLLALPAVGQTELRVLTPLMLEVAFISAPAEGAMPTGEDPRSPAHGHRSQR